MIVYVIINDEQPVIVINLVNYELLDECLKLPQDITLQNQWLLQGDVEGELCEETGVDIVGALDIISEVYYDNDELNYIIEKITST